MNKEKEFQLKEGKLIVLNHSKMVTSASSEKDIISVLKASKSNIKHFAKYPENWEDIVDGKTDLSSKNMPELKGMAEALGLEFQKNIKKTQLLEMIEEAIASAEETEKTETTEEEVEKPEDIEVTDAE